MKSIFLLLFFLSSKGSYFASCSHDRTVRLWTTEHPHPLRIFAGHLSDVNVREVSSKRNVEISEEREIAVETLAFRARDHIPTPHGPRTHGNVFLRFCIAYCSQGNREQPAHYLKQYKNAGKRFRVYGAMVLARWDTHSWVWVHS